MKTDPPTPPLPQRPPVPPRPRGRVFDVMAPGKALPHPSARPVVIGRKPAAQHAQMHVSGIGAPEPREKLLETHDKVRVQPTVPQPAQEATTPPAPAAVASEVSVVPAIPAEAPVEATVPAPAPSEASQPPTPPSVGEVPLQQPVDPLAVVAREPEEPAPPIVEHPPAPPIQDDSLPEDVAPPSIEHQVVVSHLTTASRSPGKIIGIVLLAVLFILIIVDILMDAGIITTTIPHTHFFG